MKTNNKINDLCRYSDTQPSKIMLYMTCRTGKFIRLYFYRAYILPDNINYSPISLIAKLCVAYIANFFYISK